MEEDESMEEEAEKRPEDVFYHLETVKPRELKEVFDKLAKGLPTDEEEGNPRRGSRNRHGNMPSDRK